MDRGGGWWGGAFSVYEEDSLSGCSIFYFVPPRSELLQSQESCVRRPCEDGETQEHTQSKPTAKKTKQSSISRFFQVETILEMGLQKGCEQVCV